jgi:predicted RNase H-like HicB family nuclease
MGLKRKAHGKREDRITVDEATVRLHIEPLAEGGYVATSPDVPGLVAEGRSITEAVEIAQGLTRKIVESCLEHNDPLPAVSGKKSVLASTSLSSGVSIRRSQAVCRCAQAAIRSCGCSATAILPPISAKS